MVLSQIQNNLHLISSLASFRLINEYQIDVGGQVRDRAEKFLRFLRDDPNPDHSRAPAAEPPRRYNEPPPPPPRYDEPPRRAPERGYDSGFGADAPSSEDAWKSNIKWDDDEAPSAGSGGKFKFKIKPAGETAGGAAAIKPPPTIGSAGASSAALIDTGDAGAPGGGEVSLFDAPAAPAAQSASLFDAGGFDAPPQPASTNPDPFGDSPFGGGGGGAAEIASLFESAPTMAEQSLAAAFSPTPGGADPFAVDGQSDGFGASAAAEPDPPAADDPWGLINESNVVNLSNLNVSKAEQAAAAPAPAKASLAQLAAKQPNASAPPKPQPSAGAPFMGGSPAPMGGMPGQMQQPMGAGMQQPIGCMGAQPQMSPMCAASTMQPGMQPMGAAQMGAMGQGGMGAPQMSPMGQGMGASPRIAMPMGGGGMPRMPPMGPRK